MNTELVIDVAGLCKSFNNKMVVDNLNLHVKKGEVFGFLGPNGSGKTTSIRMLCGLLTPDKGKGSCLGYNLFTESEKIKRHVGYMTQKFSFYTDLSIEQNLDFIARIYNVPDRQKKVEQALEELNLKERRKQLTAELSGGWKQRLALAACLLHKPRLLLLDEPTAGVDPLARREFWNKIHALSDEGVTIFISTHYMDEAERCTRLAYLAFGKLLITGTVDQVIQSTGLFTWELKGAISPTLLITAKKLTGVTQAAFFGSQIHLCGYDKADIEKDLRAFAHQHKLKWQEIPTTLEDTFISLVKKTQGEDE